MKVREWDHLSGGRKWHWTLRDDNTTTTLRATHHDSAGNMVADIVAETSATICIRAAVYLNGECYRDTRVHPRAALTRGSTQTVMLSMASSLERDARVSFARARAAMEPVGPDRDFAAALAGAKAATVKWWPALISMPAAVRGLWRANKHVPFAARVFRTATRAARLLFAMVSTPPRA